MIDVEKRLAEATPASQRTAAVRAIVEDVEQVARDVAAERDAARAERDELREGLESCLSSMRKFDPTDYDSCGGPHLSKGIKKLGKERDKYKRRAEAIVALADEATQGGMMNHWCVDCEKLVIGQHNGSGNSPLWCPECYASVDIEVSQITELHARAVALSKGETP